MSARNTPQAPALQHCHSCGATRLQGHGEVTDFRGEPTCDDCRTGAPNQAPDLAVDPIRAQQADRVADLYGAVDALRPRMPTIGVQVFHPFPGVAAILPNGYRWHLSANLDLAVRATSQLSCRLFTPDREFFPGLPPLMLPEVDDLPNLLALSKAPGLIGEAIEAHLLARTEIECFDPDALLTGDACD